MRRAYRKLNELRARHRWIRWAEDVFVLVVLLTAVMAWQTRGLVSSGEAAPAFELRDLSGKTWTSEELKGRKVVLHFWAPWCSVCKAETGAINSLHESMGDDEVVLSVAAAYEDEQDVRAFVQAEGVEYPVLLGNDALTRAFKISAFPTTYFLSEEGKIKRAAVGYTTGVGLRLRHWF